MKIRYSFVLPILLSLVCTACFSTPEPPAELTFIGFAPKGYNYELTFNSGTDFFAHYWERERRPVVTRFLKCSLDGDTDFSVDHVLLHYMRGSIEPEEERMASDAAQFTYRVLLNFQQTDSNGSSTQDLDAAAIKELLAGRSTIPCKVVMTIFWSKPYYSKTMQVPVKALLDAVNVDP
ncbi:MULTISPECIES: hypothetical protein [unclassified Dyella]|uniref:hypothetical protein n=1 Tax=unclassified Dyella TaxID=2634549 RepID=UPI000C842323|nr:MULTISPECIES: hypothetical protein [unclassified Dyella]MDR3445866.1 hypothetical protein [Dyella sp.]PMQ04390.1 hypothetical protein DyAD56_15420 [Dyella sp. AD56]